ncbi:MAG: UDP-N-acetylmuramate--L-alanine ligase [Parcubacteria group bacterium]|nr:UDP-N-acetylmuramate--L-alanine ligase [Parcubacteria group bacterium]
MLTFPASIPSEISRPRVGTSTTPKVHFVGIGGIGLSALARWFKAYGWEVSGSDSADSQLLKELKKEGMEISIGHSASRLPKNARLVVYSNAVPSDNPELLKAKSLKLKAISYPEALGELTRAYSRTVAVAGSHGKSTTTALVSLILINAGLDPTVIIGTKLRELNGANFRFGKSNYLVIEADEWKGAFWNYSPTLAIVTNVDREHLDFYKNFGNVKKSFLKFIANIQPGGILVANQDDKQLYAMRGRIRRIAAKKELRVLWYTKNKKSVAAKIKKIIRIPGSHNLSNALAAYELAKQLDIKGKIILKAVKTYRGSWRRMEYRGQLITKNSKLKTLVSDDYAHHPTDINATLAAFREKFQSAGRRTKIICVFQPHQADRLKRLFKEFETAFKDADSLILLPIYKVAGRDKPDKRFTSETLAKKIPIPGAIYLENPKKLPKLLNDTLLKTKNSKLKTIVVMMGAGDIVKYTELLLR